MSNYDHPATGKKSKKRGPATKKQLRKLKARQAEQARLEGRAA